MAMYRLMLLSFINLFSYSGNTSNYLEAKEPITPLTAMPNEVWSFPINKSDLQKVCKGNASLWWFKQENRLPDCTIELNKWIEKAGKIDFVSEEKYTSVTFETNGALDGKQFAIETENGGILFDYFYKDGDLLSQAKASENIVTAIQEGNEVTISFCKDYCNENIIIANGTYHNEASLAEIELITNTVNCSCSHEYLAEIKIPCVEGCYQLALREGEEVTPLAWSIPIQVTKDQSDSVYLSWGEYGQRIPAKLTKQPLSYETTERNLSNGSFARNGYKVYDVYRLTTEYNSNEYAKMLLQVLNRDDVRINGKKLYLKGFEPSGRTFEEFNASFILYDLDTNISTNNICNTNTLSNIELVNNTNYPINITALQEDTIIKEFQDSTYLAEGNYCLNVRNKYPIDITYQIVKNGIVTSCKGDILKKKKKCIGVDICQCDNIKIVIDGKECS